MQIKVEWNTGKPTVPGIYFVAIKLSSAAGFYDFLIWGGKAWESDISGEVVAYIDAYKLKEHIDVKWPFPETINYQPSKLPLDDKDLWSEG